MKAAIKHCLVREAKQVTANAITKSFMAASVAIAKAATSSKLAVTSDAALAV